MAGAGIHPYHHQQWPPSAAPPPPSAAPPPPPPNAVVPMPPPPLDNRPPSDEQVRTIFISGLPEDVKERELQNLLRWLPGYEASQINYKGEHPMGFALFTSPDFAHAAKDALQNMVFDAESKLVLHTEMAKKNLFIKRGIVADANAFDQSKCLRTGGDYSHTGYASPSPFHPSPAPVWGPHGNKLMESGTGTASGGSKHLNLKNSFWHTLHFLLTEFSFQDFCKAFPSFTSSEHGKLFQLYAQVITALHEHMLDDFDLVCQKIEVGTLLDYVEDLVEEQSLDPLCFQKSNLAHLRHELLTMKQNEVLQLKEALDKVEDRKHSIKAQIKLLKNSHQNSSVSIEAIEKFGLAMEKYGDFKE